MRLGDGDGFVSCVCGERHWGLHGAAGLLLSDPRRGVLLQHRAGWTHHGGSWALPGGAVRSEETPAEAATRETEEETAVPADAVRVVAARAEDHGTWSYTTVLATARGAVRPRVANAESLALDWVPPDDVATYPLHHSFAASWPVLREQLDRELVLIVDAANVVGSRPDGWWRDRAAAAARLRDRLAALSCAAVRGVDVGLGRSGVDVSWLWWPRIVLVVEGAAVSTPSVPGVEVVAAEHDGDSAIVRATKELRDQRRHDHIVVVTADRPLRDEVRGDATVVIGPGTVWGLLDACG